MTHQGGAILALTHHVQIVRGGEPTGLQLVKFKNGRRLGGAALTLLGRAKMT